jgi:glycine cleavage system aminomethyltransferase T
VTGSDSVENGDVIVVRTEPVGQVTTAGYSIALKKCIGMGWVPIELAKKDALFSIIHEGRSVNACLVSDAFYDPDGKRMKS